MRQAHHNRTSTNHQTQPRFFRIRPGSNSESQTRLNSLRSFKLLRQTFILNKKCPLYSVLIWSPRVTLFTEYLFSTSSNTKKSLQVINQLTNKKFWTLKEHPNLWKVHKNLKKHQLEVKPVTTLTISTFKMHQVRAAC